MPSIVSLKSFGIDAGKRAMVADVEVFDRRDLIGDKGQQAGFGVVWIG